MPRLKKLLWAAAIAGVGLRFVGRRRALVGLVELEVVPSVRGIGVDFSEPVGLAGSTSASIGQLVDGGFNHANIGATELPIEITVYASTGASLRARELDGARVVSGNGSRRLVLRVDDYAGGVVSIELDASGVRGGDDTYAGPLFVSVFREDNA